MSGESFDLGRFVGASEAISPQVLVLYIPDHDQNGTRIDASPWIRLAADLLTRIGGGAPHDAGRRGSWLNQGTGETIRERTVQVFTYIDPDRFMAEKEALRSLLHRFGIETRQGQVVFEFDGEMIKIDEFNDVWARGE